MAIRKAGLVFSVKKLEVQNVSGRHTTKCCDCDDVPRVLRVVSIMAGGKFSRQEVRCRECGRKLFKRLAFLLRRADEYLDGKVRTIRPDIAKAD